MNEADHMTLRAVFVADTSEKRKGFTGARCELPNGQIIETRDRRTPLYDLARKLEELGFGYHKIQIFTPTGTPSLKGEVAVLAELMVEESDKGGLRLRKYRPFLVAGAGTQSDLGHEGTEPPENEETRLGDSRRTKEAA